MLRFSCHMMLSMALVLTTFSASAQINPFRDNRSGPQLTATDLNLLGDSVLRLNQSPGLEVGSKEPWINPATGSHGTSVVTRIFTSSQRPCHMLHHEFFPLGRATPSNYNLTWCRVADGKWKIKS